MLLFFILQIYATICVPPFKELQGFGTDMDIKISRQVIAVDQPSFISYIQPHTLINLAPNLTLNLKHIILINKTNDIIIQGPGTLLNFGVYVEHSKNIILHNIRIINASIYGVLIYNSSYVVLNALTILDASRGSVDQGKCIDITENTSNVTVSRTILGYTHFSQVDKYKGMLITNFTSDKVTNISIHDNLFYQNYQRSPQISTNGLFDLRNNIIYGYTVYGTRVRESAYGNFQNNYYIGGRKDPLVFVGDSAGKAFSSSNFWKYDYATWRDIQDMGTKRYQVPNVTYYDYSALIANIQRIGCQIQTYIQKQIKQTVLKYSSLNQNYNYLKS